MAVIVVGGSGKGVGKTALVCGLIRALPELRWTAVKISSHEHGDPGEIWEAAIAGSETDTARYLDAGAKRAFLVPASEGEIPLGRFWEVIELGRTGIPAMRSAGAKAHPHSMAIAARLKSCPVTKQDSPAACETHDDFGRLAARLESGHDTTQSYSTADEVNIIFESNRIVEYLTPDLCLGVLGTLESGSKPSFEAFMRRADAFVASAEVSSHWSGLISGKCLFRWTDPEHISAELLTWVRSALRF